MSEADRIGGAKAGALDVGVASGTEFRQDQRYEVEGDAEVVLNTSGRGATVLRGRILDISSTGCYIQTLARVPLSLGTEVSINFSIYGTTFRLTAISRFAKVKVGIGFRFFEMSEVTRRRLQAVLLDIRSKAIKDDPDAAPRVVERMAK